MLDDLVERHVVEARGLVVGRPEQAHPSVQAEVLGDAPEVLVGVHAVRVAATRRVIRERLAEPAADVQHANIPGHPAEGGRVLAVEPRSHAVDLLRGRKSSSRSTPRG